MKTNFIILILFLASITTSFSQNNLTKTNKDKKFTKFDNKELGKYGEDLVKYFEDYQQEDIQTLITDFISLYTGFSDDKKKKIIKTSNFYLKKRASKTPHFTNYFKIVILMHESSRDITNYDVLENMIEEVLVKKRLSIKTVNDNIEDLLLLHEKNIICSNRGRINWSSSNPTFKLVYDKELSIYIENTTLKCKDPSDSLMIFNTSGRYVFDKKMWIGQGGKVTWEKAGLDPNEVYIELDEYDIDLTRREYKVETVNLTHTKYFTSPIIGSFYDKVQNVSNPEDKTFPKFEAKEEVEIKNVLDQIDYIGPFSMKGSAFIGSNENHDYAYLEIKKLDTTKVYARSRSFAFEGNKISSRNTKIQIPLSNYGSDSVKGITHPSVLLQIQVDSVSGNRQVEMIRSNEGLGKSSFYNTYHNLEMDFERLAWAIDSSSIDFSNLVGAITASGIFKTLDNFDLSDYYKLQLSETKNSLIEVEKYGKLFKTQKIDLKGMTQYMKMQEYQVSQMLLKLAIKGFIVYDPETGKGEILPRLHDYLAFKRGAKDFDFITINSELDSANAGRSNSKIASLDIEKLDLTINNVQQIPLSPLHNVVCIPDSSSVVMQENRNFTFDGTLRTEFLEFYGSGFEFKFDSFRFNLNNIEYLKILIRGDTLPNLSEIEQRDGFYYPEGIASGAGILKERVYNVVDTLLNPTDTLIRKEVVKSRIENITGELIIDHAGNRSGKSRDYPQYPIFKCQDTAYVYYDKYYEENSFGETREEPILDGQYKRDKFYFMIMPFEVDSIGNFTANSWQTPGTFHSSIMKDFDEDLTILQDTIMDNGSFTDSVTIYSLGFVRDKHEEYDVYKGVGKEQGHAFNALRLSNKGLRGIGYLEYLTAKIESYDFVYFPEFMVTDAYNTVVNESNKGTEYASSMGRDNFIEWLPAQDTLIISSGIVIDSLKSPNWKLFKQTKLDISQVREPLEMYNGQAVLTGQSIITPSAHVGWGTMEFSNSELTSNRFVFKMDDYSADTANFLIKPIGFITPAFTAFNVNSHIDYRKSLGEFKSNGKSSTAFFPVNQFKTYMDQFVWDIDKNEIEVGVGDILDDTKKIGSEYVSTNPLQDSLRFISYSSGYSLEDFILRCYDVDSILISNGTIYPDSTIVIKENAEIDPLYNSVIVVDNTNKYHKIKDGIITLLGRNEIKGTGSIDYLFISESETGKDSIIYNLQFSSVSANRNDSIIRAYGKIEPEKQINLSENFINYTGNITLYTNEKYLRFSGNVSLNNECAQLETQDIQFDGSIDPDSTVLEYSGDPVNSLGRKIISGFYTSVDSLYTSFLGFSKDHKDVPFFSDSGVLYYNKQNFEYVISTKEKYLNPDTIGDVLAFNNRYCYMTAKGDLDLGANLGQVKLKAIGNSKHNFQNNEISLRTFLSIDFFFNDKALELLADDIFNSLTVGIDQSDLYPEAVKRLVGVNRAKKLNEELSVYGEFRKIPAELEKTFVFSEINFKWNPFTHSYQNDGSLNLVNIKDKQLNRVIPGYIEIVKKRSGDEIFILLEPSGKDWYLFQYAGGRMFAVSSNSDFVKLIKDTKEGDRKQDVSDGESFMYLNGSAVERENLIQRITGKNLPDDDIDENESDTDMDENLEDEGFGGE